MALTLADVMEQVEIQFSKFLEREPRLKQNITNRKIFIDTFNISSREVAKDSRCFRKMAFTTVQTAKSGYPLPKDANGEVEVDDIIKVSYEFEPLGELFKMEALRLDNDVFDSDDLASSATWTDIP